MIDEAAITPCFTPSGPACWKKPKGMKGWKFAALNAGKRHRDEQRERRDLAQPPAMR